MTTPRVQKHRKVEANRRRVTTRGKRVRRPRQLPPPSRRMKRRTGATVGVLGLLTAICSFGGAVFTVAGAVTTAVGGVTVAWIEYRRDLIEVKRTGRPIGQPTKQPDPVKPEPKSADWREPYVRQRDKANAAGSAPTAEEVMSGGQKPPVRKPRSRAWPPKGHNPKCRAKSAATCRCPKGRTGAKRNIS